jgi:hypothetical protein
MTLASMLLASLIIFIISLALLPENPFDINLNQDDAPQQGGSTNNGIGK